MIQLNGVSKSFGPQVLFEDLTLAVGKGEKLGFVGRNGSGKSTLFKIILGEMTGDSGEILIPKGYKIGTIEQHLSFTKDNVLDECVQALSAEESYDTYKAEKILFGLGFKGDDLKKNPKLFSGGYQIRINLAKLLLKNPDLLLLDEPSNYLDIVSLRWLKGFLKGFPGEFILITHDREFMDSVSTHTIGLHRKRMRKVKGDTLKFFEQVHLEEEVYEQTRLNMEKKRKEMEDFVNRFKAKASKAAQAQSRMKMLEKMGTLERLSQEKDMGLNFHFSDCPAKVLMEINDLSFHYVPEKPLIKNLSFTVGKNDRIGIIGKNGKGKSTLLNLIAGELTPVEGTISSHHALKQGLFGQTNIKRLSDEATIIEEISFANGDLSVSQVRSICGAMMFEGTMAEKKIKVLSGGERSRVLLGKIIAKPSNLLLLDEPTNHLDVESIEVMTEEIDEYPGAVLIVTHSEHILRSLVNKLIVFHKGGAEFFHGTYDEFLEKIGWEDEIEDKAQGNKEKLSYREIKQRRAELVSERSKILNPLKKEIERCEGLITRHEERLKSIDEEMIAASEKSDSHSIQKLVIEKNLLDKEIEEAFEKLSEISPQAEEIEKKYQDLLAELD